MTFDTDRIAAAETQVAAIQAELDRLRAEIADLETVDVGEQERLDRVLTKFGRLRGLVQTARRGRAPGLPPRNGAPPVTPVENTRLGLMSPEELARTDLTVGDTGTLFSEDYMLGLAAAPIRGEGDPKLKDLMREIEKGIPDPRRTEVMTALSSIVGVPPTADTLGVDYDRFLIVRKQQAIKGARKKDKVDSLDEGMHPDFLASRSQLVFGKVLGDAFGIHEVFAALLSPTGGLVGPGNWLIPGVVEAGHLDPDNPVALHGTVHDAAGYLGKFHDEGPGYNYRESPIEILGAGNPLSGQVTGIAFWVAEVGEDYARRRVDTAVVEMEKKLKPARDAVQAEIDLRVAQAKRQAQEAIAAAEKLAAEAEKAALGVAEAIDAAGAEVEKAAVETFDTATKAISDAVPEEARRKLKAAWSYIWS